MSAYDVFRPEFDRMSDQERLEIGLAGIAAMHERGGFVTTAKPSAPRKREPDSFGLGSRGREELTIENINRNINTDISSFDDDAALSLVDRMKRETYRVRVTNILGDLLEPLGYKLDDILLRQQMFDTRMHNEHFLYYRSMIGAINNLGTTNRDNFFEGLILQYRNFMRHPVWNSLRILADRVLRPLANMVSGVLFGFKKQMSDTDRIVQAIEKQTEFQRTGKIGASGNALTRLFRTGAVNSAIRTAVEVSSGGQVGINAAQGAREKQARGEAVGFYDKLSMRWFGKYADFFDTKQEDKHNTSLLNVNHQMYEKLDRLVDILSQIQSSPPIAIPHQVDEYDIRTLMVMNAIAEAKDNQIETLTMQMKAMAAVMAMSEQQREAFNVFGGGPSEEETEDRRRTADSVSDIARLSEENREETEEVEEEKLSLLEKIRKYLGKHDRRETRRSLTGLLGGVAGFIGKILPGLGLGALGIGAGAVAWNALPEDIRQAIKDGFMDLGRTATDAVLDSMSWTDWAGVVGAGLLATKLGGPLGMTVGGALIAMAWFADKARRDNPDIDDFMSQRESWTPTDPEIAGPRNQSAFLVLREPPEITKEKNKLNDLIRKREEIFANVDELVATTPATYESLDRVISDLDRSIQEMEVGISNLSNILGTDGLISQPALEAALRVGINDPSVWQRATGAIRDAWDGMRGDGAGEGLIEFLKKEEGYRDKAYWDVKQYSIGYGSGTVNGKPVTAGQTINRDEAETALRDDLARRRSQLERGLGGIDVPDGYMDALLSLSYNVGVGAVLDSSLPGSLKRGDDKEFERGFLSFNKVMRNGRLVESDAISSRRRAELDMASANTPTTPVFSPTVPDSPRNESIIPQRPDAGGQQQNTNVQSDGETKDILRQGFRSMTGGFTALAQSIYEVIGESSIDGTTASIINGDN